MLKLHVSYVIFDIGFGQTTTINWALCVNSELTT